MTPGRRPAGVPARLEGGAGPARWNRRRHAGDASPQRSRRRRGDTGDHRPASNGVRQRHQRPMRDRNQLSRAGRPGTPGPAKRGPSAATPAAGEATPTKRRPRRPQPRGRRYDTPCAAQRRRTPPCAPGGDTGDHRRSAKAGGEEAGDDRARRLATPDRKGPVGIPPPAKPHTAPANARQRRDRDQRDQRQRSRATASGETTIAGGKSKLAKTAQPARGEASAHCQAHPGAGNRQHRARSERRRAGSDTGAATAGDGNRRCIDVTPVDGPSAAVRARWGLAGPGTQDPAKRAPGPPCAPGWAGGHLNARIRWNAALGGDADERCPERPQKTCATPPAVATPATTTTPGTPAGERHRRRTHRRGSRAVQCVLCSARCAVCERGSVSRACRRVLASY